MGTEECRRVFFFAKVKLPTFQDGFQVKTDVVKGIQISSIFQARGQDATYFRTHPNEIFHKSPSNEICQIHKTISRAAIHFAVFAYVFKVPFSSMTI